MHHLLSRPNADQDAQAFYPYSEYWLQSQHAVYYLKRQFLFESVLEPDYLLTVQVQSHVSHFEKSILDQVLRLLLLIRQVLVAVHHQFPDGFARYGYDKSLR